MWHDEPLLGLLTSLPTWRTTKRPNNVGILYSMPYTTRVSLVLREKASLEKLPVSKPPIFQVILFPSWHRASRYWDRLSTKASKTYLTRALPLWEDYVHGIVQEAINRNAGYIRDIGSFIELRRKTIGVTICAALHFLFTEIPDEVLDHPTMQRLVEPFINIMIYDNVHNFLTIQTQESNTYFPPQDILSYQKEDAANEPHNILSLYACSQGFFARSHRLDGEGNRQMCRREFVQLQHQRFWDDPALDGAVRGYILSLGEVIRGHNSWAFERERYFGKDNVSVQQTFMYSGIKQKFFCWEGSWGTYIVLSRSWPSFATNP